MKASEMRLGAYYISAIENAMLKLVGMDEKRNGFKFSSLRCDGRYAQNRHNNPSQLISEATPDAVAEFKRKATERIVNDIATF